MSNSRASILIRICEKKQTNIMILLYNFVSHILSFILWHFALWSWLTEGKDFQFPLPPIPHIYFELGSDLFVFFSRIYSCFGRCSVLSFCFVAWVSLLLFMMSVSLSENVVKCLFINSYSSFFMEWLFLIERVLLEYFVVLMFSFVQINLVEEFVSDLDSFI